MKNNILYAPDGAQGGDPADKEVINLNQVGIIFAERILALSKDKQERYNPEYPDSKRMLNYPLVDNSPIDYCGFKSLKDLGEYVANSLAAEAKANKEAKNNKQPRFITAIVATNSEIANLRIFSFKGLPDPAESEQGYVTAGITRQERVKFIGGGVSTYGRTVKDGAAIPAAEQTKAEVPQAKEATKAKPAIV